MHVSLEKPNCIKFVHLADRVQFVVYENCVILYCPASITVCAPFISC